MHTPPTYHYGLGAIGWARPEWVGPFYPEDMPPEWHLSFYNTEFECVYLPYPVWSKATLDEMAIWREDTLERFRFLLEPPPEALSADDEARLSTLGEKGILATAHDGPIIVWVEPEVDLKSLATQLQGKQDWQTTYLVSVSGDHVQLAQLRTLLGIMGY